jgi:chemotaxis protein histidine kinase CheA
MNAQKLNEEFPDLGASVILDLMNTHKEVHKVREILSVMTSKDPEPLDRKLESLKDFLHLGREVIIKVLQENQYDVDMTIIKLVELNSEKQPPANLETILRNELGDFVDLGRDFIINVLRQHNWNPNDAIIPLFEAKRDKERKLEKEKLEKERLEKEKTEKEKLVKEEQVRKIKEEQMRRMLEEEQLRKLKEEEHIRKVREEQDRKKKEEDALRKLREEEQLRKLREQEQLRKLQEAELRRMKEEEHQRKLREEEQKRKFEEEKFKFEEEQLRNQKEEELRRLREEERLNRIREEEQLRKFKDEAERIKQLKLEAEKDTNDFNPWNLKPVDNKTVPVPFQFESPKYLNPLEASTTEFVHINTTKSNEGDIKLIASPDHVECGENINVIWEHTSKPNANDWIALYPINTIQDKDYSSFCWVTPEKTGSISIKTPSKPGTYVFKYFVNRSYVCWASSNTFRVGPAYRLTHTVVGTLQVRINIDQIFGTPSSSAWIGMYEIDKDNKSYQQYNYLGDKKEILFIAPKSGKWEFRIFPSKAYDYTDSIFVEL